MNFSPQNEQGLAALLAGLQHGMDPSQAYSVFQGIQSEQQAQAEERKARLQGLSQLLTQSAMQGMSYGGAQALAEAQPGPMGPAVDSMLSALYPSGEPTPPATNANGAVMDSPSSGVAPMAPGVPVTNAPQNMFGEGAGAMSPTYQPPPPDASMVQAQQEAQQDSAWATFTQTALEGKRRQMDPTQVVEMFANASPENAQLVGSDPSRLKGVLTAIYGSIPVSQAGAVPQL